MTWDIARRPMRCTSLNCQTTVPVGERFRWMAGGNWAICIACAKRRFDEDPPADMPQGNVYERWRSRTVQPMPKIADVVDFKIAQYEPKDGDE
jgi:hypothetical protein